MSLRTTVRTIADMNAAIVANLGRIPSDVDVVAGIPRSGLLSANMVALHLNLPLTDIDGLLENRVFRTGKRPLRRGGDDDVLQQPRHVLVVDDVVSQGRELKRIRDLLHEAGLPHRYTFLTVYAFPDGVGRADITLEAVPRPMVFEWSFMHSQQVRDVCLDIDGILCLDPTPEQDDDGDNYVDFLANAQPLFLPTQPARALVTSRLEKYRPQTEAWLDAHGVQYQELIMMPHATAAERSRAQRHARFKADAYKQTGAVLFVESNPGLAFEIAQLSGRPVLALTTNEIFHRDLRNALRVRWQRVTWWGRRLRRAPRKVLSLARSRLGSGSGDS